MSVSNVNIKAFNLYEESLKLLNLFFIACVCVCVCVCVCIILTRTVKMLCKTKSVITSLDKHTFY